MKIKWEQVNSNLNHWIAEGIGEVEHEVDGWYFRPIPDENRIFGPLETAKRAMDFGRDYRKLMEKYIDEK